MALYVFDGAYAAGDVAAAKAAGGICAMHYLTGNFATTSFQVAAVRAAGMGAGLNYEEATDELLGGAAAGTAAARKATAAALALDGVPTDNSVAICYSVDTEVQPAQFPAVGAAFDAIRAVHAGRWQVKAYAEGALIDYLCTGGHVDGKLWLSESSGFPGFNPDSPNVCMVQNHIKNPDGTWTYVPSGQLVPGTDFSTVTDPQAIAAWWPAGSPYDPPPPAPKPVSEVDMRIVQDIGRDKAVYAAAPGYWRHIPTAREQQTLTPPGVQVEQLGSDQIDLLHQAMLYGSEGPHLADLANALTVANAAVAALSATVNGDNTTAQTALTKLQAAVAALSPQSQASLDAAAVVAALGQAITKGSQ